MTWALLPLKDLVKAKSRLSGLLAPHERRALAQAMVEDVLEVLTRADGLEGVLLVSDDPAAEMLAGHYRVDLVEERYLGCQGLNDAVASATSWLRARGVDHIMVLHGDLPLLARADVEDALALYRDNPGAILLGPDGEGTGTNMMIFPTANAPRFQYGEGSCSAHSASAREQGQSVIRFERPGLQCDVDSPADVIAVWRILSQQPPSSHSAQLLCQGETAIRLEAVAREQFREEQDGNRYDAI